MFFEVWGDRNAGGIYYKSLLVWLAPETQPLQNNISKQAPQLRGGAEEVMKRE